MRKYPIRHRNSTCAFFVRQAVALYRDYSLVKDGFFILVGNKDQSCRDALIEHRGRARIEGFFRDAKTYLSILPIGKWTKERALGKIMHDIIETTFYREYRRRVSLPPLA